MTDRYGLWLPMAVLGMLALFSFWIEQSVKESSIRSGVNLEEPDSIVENFLAISTDAAGVPRYRLAAAKLSHFSGDRQTLLDAPKLTHLHASQGEMRISSSKASVSPGGDRLVFTGQVNVLRPADEARREMSLQTSYLEVLTDSNEALTGKPVVIRQPGLQISAAGLHLFADSRLLKLKGRVKAQFQNAKRA